MDVDPYSWEGEGPEPSPPKGRTHWLVREAAGATELESLLNNPKLEDWDTESILCRPGGGYTLILCRWVEDEKDRPWDGVL